MDIGNILALIARLSTIAGGLVPGIGQIPVLVGIAAQLIAYIQAQGGLTLDQILERAGLTLDENEKRLLEDEVRLRIALELQLGHQPVTDSQ